MPAGLERAEPRRSGFRRAPWLLATIGAVVVLRSGFDLPQMQAHPGAPRPDEAAMAAEVFSCGAPTRRQSPAAPPATARPHGPTTSKEVEGIRMTHTIHITTAPTTKPAVIGAEAREEADRELSAARAELASLGAAASPSRLERALERLDAAQRASRRPIPQAA